jgi:hypothetical protein
VVADLVGEFLSEPAAGSERDDEAQPGILDLRERLGVPAGRVADQQPRVRSGQGGEAFQAGADQRQLRRVAGIRAPVDGDPVRRARLQRPDLAHDLAVGAPALGHQRGVLVGAGHTDRRQIDVQAADIDAEALDRARRDRSPDHLRVDGELLQRAAEPVIVQQRGRNPQQLLHRRPRRPPGQVIQRRGRAQPARDQRLADLTDRQLRARRARRHRRVDDRE